MPELPEVETVCRVMRRALEGKKIVRAEVVRDPIVFSGKAPNVIEKALVGRKVVSVGRHGKFFWLTLSGKGPTVYGHLGMSGWIRDVGKKSVRLIGHGDAPLDDRNGQPRFLRLLLHAGDGSAIAYTDPRRLGRIWLGVDPESEPRVKRLGPDAFNALPLVGDLMAKFARRKKAIKTVLLDQSVIAGVGNWIADEVLYQAKIAPKRLAPSLTKKEVGALHRAIRTVLAHAVKVGSDHERFPKTWIFSHRWGGSRGSTKIAGHPIVREDVGGRTTAWVPTRQK